MTISNLLKKSMILVLVIIGIVKSVCATDPDIGRDMISMVTSKGFPIEQHYVTTEDGYILSLFRIPKQGGKPVLLQHGLLDSSYTWVNNFRDQSLAYLLSDAGYDVWLSNSRGNTWSKRHVSLSPSSKAFWEFTWDEMAKYDIVANVNYVLNSTGHEKLSYVGHSQGTIQAFAGFSENSDLASKINHFVGLGPVIVAHNSKSPIFDMLVPFASTLSKLLNLFGEEEFLPSSSLLEKLDPTLCADLPSWACNDILFLVAGPTHHTNASRIPVYISETPAGTSTYNMVHWAQLVHTGKFQKYDFGCGLFTCENKKHYGQKTPPQYSVSNFTVPVSLYYGSNDYLADPKDVQILIAGLPDNILTKSKEIEGYAHLDFVWAQDANTMVYADVLEDIRLAWS